MNARVARWTAVSLLAAGLGCAAEGNDRVELRSGETLDGRVEGYASDALRFETAEATRRWSRAQIAAIALDLARPGPAEMPEAPEPLRKDRFLLRSGGLRLSRLEAIDDDSVVTRDERFDREEVFRIELAPEPRPGRAARDEEDGEETPACWRGTVHVRDRYRRPRTPQEAVGRKCPPSVETWVGAATVRIDEHHALGLDGKPSGEVILRYGEIACELSTPGWERVCDVPETYGPALEDHHVYQLGFRVGAIEQPDRVGGDDAAVQSAGFWFLDVPETPSGVWPDAGRYGWRPGQYLLLLPACGKLPDGVALVIEKWHGSRREGPVQWPTIRELLPPHFFRPWFSLGFAPGNTRQIDYGTAQFPTDDACWDEARFAEDGGVMQGETECRREDSAGVIEIYEARWELERSDDCDTPLPEPEDFDWPADPGFEEEFTLR